MSSAPKGSYNSWVLPDGRLLRCSVIVGAKPRLYSITADGVFIGFVVRWNSGRGVWRAQFTEEGWASRSGEPLEWFHRGDAIDYLVEASNEPHE